MAKSFADRFKNLTETPMVREVDEYIENEVLSESKPIPDRVGEEQQPAKEPSTQKSNSRRENTKPSSDGNYPTPFFNELDGNQRHVQAVVSARTYANMGLLKTLRACDEKTFVEMATKALEQWVDAKIREYCQK